MRKNNKRLYESNDRDDLKTWYLMFFIEKNGNANKCKELVRCCTKEFIKLNITSIKTFHEICNKTPLLIRDILDEYSKKIFKCVFFNLDKKYVNGLSHELLKYIIHFASKNITQDTPDDWAPMYNVNESYDTRLYESIMRDVAETVKKHLNESSEQYENDVDELTSMIDWMLRSSQTTENYGSQEEIIDIILNTITDNWEDSYNITTIKKCLEKNNSINF